MDSLLAMLPTGMAENNSNLGQVVSHDLNEMLKAMDYKGSILISAHSKKEVAGFNLAEIETKEMQALVRGHGSIVGLCCDTGIAIHKETKFPDPTRFSLCTKARRLGIPASDKPLLIELEEEQYAGQGWAKLTQVDDSLIPPSDNAISIYRFFAENRNGVGPAPHTSEQVVRKFAYLNKAEVKRAVEELFRNKVILNFTSAQIHIINPDLDIDVPPYYLDILRTKLTI